MDPLPARSRHLLLDNRVVEKMENARIALGSVKKQPANPLFGEDKPWEARFDNRYANARSVIEAPPATRTGLQPPAGRFLI